MRAACLTRRAFLHGSARAVILSGLGANLLSACDVIIEDYLLTNTLCGRGDRGAHRPRGPARRRTALSRGRGTLQAAFDEMQQSFGTLADYLGKGLGVMQDDAGMLRAKLVA